MVNPLRDHFHFGEKQNSAHYATYCKACVQKELDTIPIDADSFMDDASRLIAEHDAHQEACRHVGSTRGVKEAWIAHILGGNGVKACPNASTDAKNEARKQRRAKKAAEEDKDASMARGKTRRASEAEDSDDDTSLPDPKRLKQTTLKVYKGLDIPFTAEQVNAIQGQALRACIAGGVAFRFFRLPETLKLIYMFRTAGPDIMPSGKVLGGRLLNNAAENVEKSIEKKLKGKTVGLTSDGWKSKRRDAVNAVGANVQFKFYPLELIEATALNKDGDAMCEQFMDIIDRVEGHFQCFVLYFSTDADGGALKGRKNLVKKRPHILAPSCWGHQFQLVLGDYFKVYEFAADISAEATALVGWLNNHGKVRKIFDDAQARVSKDRIGRVVILAYIVANLTRWTTHCLSFMRLMRVKDPLKLAVMEKRGAIVKAQVGAAKSTERVQLEKEANWACDLILMERFWNGLETVLGDLEPICYGTNINQRDATRPDTVLLTLAGLYRHFKDHPEDEVKTEMVTRLEQRWKATEQALFVFAVILNPFEGLSCFGPCAGFSHLKCINWLVYLYRRIRGRPDNEDTPDEQNTKERSLVKAFQEYLSSTGAFVDLQESKEDFENLFENDPVAVWKSVQGDAAYFELASFAIDILSVVANQAGCERVFSNLKNTQTDRRTRLSIKKLEKMNKVGSQIHREHVDSGLIQPREKRKNHDSTAELLAVPRYADLLQDMNDEDETEHGRALVTSADGWRVEMAKWINAARAAHDEEDEDDPFDVPARTVPSGRLRAVKWTTMTLKTLFSDAPKRVNHLPRRALDEESRLMELLAAEHDDEPLDDGALEGSGDEYEPGE